jgi:hypothetical protein
MIICSSSNIDLIQGISGYGTVADGATDWRIENTPTGVFNILNSPNLLAPNVSIIDVGNVGIGTIPITGTNKLQVQGAASVSGLITANTLTASGLITANAGITVNTGSLTCANDTLSKTYTATNTTAGTNDILTMRYDTTNGIRFRQTLVAANDVRYDLIQKTNNVDYTAPVISFYKGNVGIGTTNPVNILQVGSGGKLRLANDNTDFTLIGASDTNSATNPRIIISGNTRSGNQGNIEYLSTTSTGMHAFYTTDSSTERMRIASNGNVSIGTTDTATYKLNVGGTINATSVLVNGAAITAGASSQWSGTANIFYNGGNVGIGTNNPTYKCHFKMSSSTAAGGLHLDVSSAGADEYTLTIYPYDYGSARVGWLFRTQSQSGGNNTPIELTYDGRVIFSKSISTGENITTTSGNVGIGTTNPTTARLVISGTAGTVGLDMSSSDQYAEMRVIRNTRWSDKDLYLQLGAGTDSKTYIYSNNVVTLICDRGSVFIGTANMPANSMQPPSSTITSIAVGNIGYGISSDSGANSGIYIGDGTTYARWRIRNGNANLNFDQNDGSGTYVLRGYFHNNTGAHSSVSDRRLKKLIQPIQYGLNDVLKLKPVSYLMKNQNEDIDKKNLGLIAQDLEDIIPEVVNISQSNDNNTTYSIQYSSIIPILIKAIQDLNDINIGYENRIKRLENLLNISNNTSNLSVDTQ